MTDQKAALQAIEAELAHLARLADQAGLSLLAFMLDQARAEAANEDRKFKK